MEIEKTDVALFVYNSGVALSGAVFVLVFGVQDRLVAIAASVVLGLFWTIYFNWKMMWRFEERFADEDEEGEEERHAGGPL